MTVERLRHSRCRDFCLLCAPLREVHRSQCKTNNFCSKVCRRADDRVHKVCRRKKSKHVEEIRVKIGGHQKGEASDANLKDFVGSLLPNLQQMPATSSVADIVKYNTALLKQIQLIEAKRQKNSQNQSFNEVD